jgi:two-component system, OmpR family, alkaline phosphatase synthesis response regulator PhoP
MPPKILVVDDEEHIVRKMRKALQRAGFDVVTASDGMDALKNVRGD